MPDANLVFLPWLRQGLASRFMSPDPLTVPLAVARSLQARLDINGAEGATVPLAVAGAGDVTGIDARQVVRMEPPPGTTDYESNDLAAIEFDNPDLPWLFTPAGADAQGRLRPWLVLIVVRDVEGVVVRPARSEAMPVLEIGAPAVPADELPDLADSWAWAHAQIAAPAGADATALLDVITHAPERTVSRLIGARLLEPFTRYVACVVPAFEAGRLSGLNLPVTGANATQLAPAWKSGAGAPKQITLPVLHHWRFATGAREDFESLVRKLVPRDLAGLVGRRPMDLDHPGFPSADLDPVLLEGALQPLHAPRAAWPDAASAPWQATLRSIVNTAASPAPDTADPLVGPPIYGRWIAGRASVGDGAPPTWLDDLNLDPRERVVAALGTRVVQDAQETLVAQAWDQAGEIDRVNQRLRQLQLSFVVGTRLHAKQVRALSTDDGALWRLAAPAQSRLVFQAATAQTPAKTLRAFIASTSTPLALTSAPMRRIARPRGAITRRAEIALRDAGVVPARAEVTAVTTVAERASSVPMIRREAAVGVFRPLPQMILVLPPARGMVSFDAVARRLPAAQAVLSYAAANDQAVGSAPARPAFRIAVSAQPTPPGTTLPPIAVVDDVRAIRRAGESPAPSMARAARDPRDPPEPPEPPEPPDPRDPRPPRPLPVRRDSADAAAFRAAAKRHLAVVNPATFVIVTRPPRVVLDALAARGTLVRLLDPAPALQARMTATISLGSDAAPPAIAPAGHAPRYDQPMSEPLAALSQDWLLPGLDRVLPDTVALLEPNPRFIEAYMAGLNVEMGRELLWRDFPLDDERATCFRRFWRPAAASQSDGDIAPLAEWGTNRLGTNAARGVPAKQSVLLVRSGLFRRYPSAIVYMTPAMRDARGRKPDIAAAHRLPLFRGSLQPDVNFFGFDVDPDDAVKDPGWYFVIEQQPTEPRFGFDVEIDFGAATHVPLAAPPAGVEIGTGLRWAFNAAHMAQITRQQPMRVAIHASELLADVAAPVPR
jgi:hypothetical protein